MASLRTQVFLKHFQTIPAKCSPFLMITRGTAIPQKKKMKKGTIKHRNLIDSNATSLAARGFLRYQKPYSPVSNVSNTVIELSQQLFGDRLEPTAHLSREDKFNLLNSCFMELEHSVPNSMLHKINTLNDVVEFYTTPVSTTTPFDELKNQDLPPNLHVQYDYVRFHPETDTKFGGITAYPESSTIVTGLKYKNKYKGHTQRTPFYYDNWSDYIKQN